jgi:hypothetical protein
MAPRPRALLPLFASAVAVGFLIRELLESNPLVAVGWGIVAAVGFVVFLYRDGRIGGRPEEA